MRASGIGIGERAPALKLPDTEGSFTSLPTPGESQATVVMWTCNHCPYALAWHDRLAASAREYADRGVRFLAVNSNDADRYPADSPRAMAERYDAKEWGMPYLHDATQEVARAFGARTTPDVFVFDSELLLLYRGAPDADHQDPAQGAAWLRSALEALLSGSEPDPAETEPIGCSIKWRP
ncbi:MAG TPA: thioredoxin family protein [Thermomicrobiaceae bacterium]|nr:thioredoxin family protein [Thermomicrobiaceae bacterium]